MNIFSFIFRKEKMILKIHWQFGYIHNTQPEAIDPYLPVKAIWWVYQFIHKIWLHLAESVYFCEQKMLNKPETYAQLVQPFHLLRISSSFKLLMKSIMITYLESLLIFSATWIQVPWCRYCMLEVCCKVNSFQLASVIEESDTAYMCYWSLRAWVMDNQYEQWEVT